MNTRIRELYEQARLHAKSIDADLDPKGWMDEYHRKFAELIVRECYGEVLCQLYDYHPSTNEQYNLGHEAGLKLAVAKMKQHFGVE